MNIEERIDAAFNELKHAKNGIKRGTLCGRVIEQPRELRSFKNSVRRVRVALAIPYTFFDKGEERATYNKAVIIVHDKDSFNNVDAASELRVSDFVYAEGEFAFKKINTICDEETGNTYSQFSAELLIKHDDDIFATKRNGKSL
jgi:hypothetical protein